MRKIRLFVFVLIAISLFSCTPTQSIYIASDACELYSFTLLKEQNFNSLDTDYAANIKDNIVEIGPIPYWTDITNLIASFEISPLASIKVNGQYQNSGKSKNNFSNFLNLTVIAENGNSKNYSINLLQTKQKTDNELLNKQITVATYNTEMSEVGNIQTADIHNDIAKILKNSSVEIAVFVEISVSDQTNDVEILKQKLDENKWPMPYSAVIDLYQDQDLAVFSKYPIINFSSVARPGIWPRPGLETVIRIANDENTLFKDLHVFAFHLKAYDDVPSLNKRIAQAKALSNYLKTNYAEALKTDYFLIAGDMNTVSSGDRENTTSTLAYLTLKDDIDSTNDFTAVNEKYLPIVNTHAMGNILDHIILSPKLFQRYKQNSVIVKKIDPFVQLEAVSDHYPVLLELEL